MAELYEKEVSRLEAGIKAIKGYSWGQGEGEDTDGLIEALGECGRFRPLEVSSSFCFLIFFSCSSFFYFFYFFLTIFLLFFTSLAFPPMLLRFASCRCEGHCVVLWNLSQSFSVSSVSRRRYALFVVAGTHSLPCSLTLGYKYGQSRLPPEKPLRNAA